MIYTDTIHFIELPNFTQKQGLTTSLSQWLAFFKYEDTSEDIMKILLKNNEILHRDHENYQRIKEDDAVLTLIRRREMEERQRLTDLKTAERKGRQEGGKNAKIEFAKSCIKRGMNTTVLSELTGLAHEEIEHIRLDIEN
ncbi:MAG: Rpn family recombination-promoting nuclease/putative transposase [Chitinivibrionales bacterium]|nr:Rpn family recombination-promoting nuclease/putative transposase [Chitinivibrionales bacterium]